MSVLHYRVGDSNRCGRASGSRATTDLARVTCSRCMGYAAGDARRRARGHAAVVTRIEPLTPEGSHVVVRLDDVRHGGGPATVVYVSDAESARAYVRMSADRDRVTDPTLRTWVNTAPASVVGDRVSLGGFGSSSPTTRHVHTAPAVEPLESIPTASGNAAVAGTARVLALAILGHVEGTEAPADRETYDKSDAEVVAMALAVVGQLGERERTLRFDVDQYRAMAAREAGLTDMIRRNTDALAKAAEAALPYLVRLGDFIGNGDPETGRFPTTDRCAVILALRTALAWVRR